MNKICITTGKEDYQCPQVAEMPVEPYSAVLNESGSLENPSQGDEWDWK